MTVCQLEAGFDSPTPRKKNLMRKNSMVEVFTAADSPCLRKTLTKKNTTVEMFSPVHLPPLKKTLTKKSSLVEVDLPLYKKKNK